MAFQEYTVVLIHLLTYNIYIFLTIIGQTNLTARKIIYSAWKFLSMLTMSKNYTIVPFEEKLIIKYNYLTKKVEN